MKQLKNASAEAQSAIHGIAFTVFFIIEQLLSEFLYPYLETHIAKPLYLAISAVVAAVLYSGLFFTIRLLYNLIVLMKDKRMRIGGVWYHVHVPYCMGKEDYTQERLSIGTTTVSRVLKDFYFDGENKPQDIRSSGSSSADDSIPGTRWHTKAIMSDENDFDIIEVYEATTKGEPTRRVDSCPCCKTKFSTPITLTEAEKHRYGVHLLRIKVKDGAMMMQGEYSDCWPSLKTGAIFFYRTKEERDERVQRFFAAAEEWKKSQCGVDK